VGGLGNRKNALVHQAIEAVGVEPYVGSVKLRHQEFKLAVVTSSQNCNIRAVGRAGVLASTMVGPRWPWSARMAALRYDHKQAVTYERSHRRGFKGEDTVG
jgi:hypothetical protein